MAEPWWEFLPFEIIPLFIFIGLIGLLCAWVAVKLFKCAWDHPVPFLFSIAGLVVGVFLYVVIVESYFPVEKEYVKDWDMPILALNDNASISGRFFLGTGSIDGSMKYFYLYQADRGIKTGYVSADESYVNETDTYSPRIEHYIQRPVGGKYRVFLPDPDSQYEDYYNLVIPKGSIMYNYRVDLQ